MYNQNNAEKHKTKDRNTMETSNFNTGKSIDEFRDLLKENLHEADSELDIKTCILREMEQTIYIFGKNNDRPDKEIYHYFLVQMELLRHELDMLLSNGGIGKFEHNFSHENINAVTKELANMGYVVMDESVTKPMGEFQEYLEEKSEEVINERTRLSFSIPDDGRINYLAGSIKAYRLATRFTADAMDHVVSKPHVKEPVFGAFIALANLLHGAAVQVEKELATHEQTGHSSSVLAHEAEGFLDALNTVMNELIDMGAIMINDR